MVRAHLLITGNVRNVGCRAFVRQIALNMNIAGFVRNIEGPAVEVYCEADSQKSIESFAEEIVEAGKPKEGFEKDYLTLRVDNVKVYFEGQGGYEQKDSPEDKDWKEYKKEFGIKYDFKKRSYQEESMNKLDAGVLILPKFRQETAFEFRELDSKYHTVSLSLAAIAVCAVISLILVSVTFVKYVL
jgi:acylphosphatase